MKKIKLAVFGGSFNPPHIGHLALAEEVIAQLGYDTVLLVPVWKNPFKADLPGATERDRIEMLKLTIAALGTGADTGSGNYASAPVDGTHAALVMELCEMERKSTSYTYDTIIHLYEKYDGYLDGKIGLVIGDDLSADFHKWYQYEQLLQLTDIIVAHRVIESDVPVFAFPHTELRNSLLPIASSDIRRRIASGGAWRALVVPSVSGYIAHGKLYGLR